MTVSVADSHNDLLLAVRHLRERGHQDPFGDFWLPQLKAGGVDLQVLPVCTEEQFVGEGALRRCLLMLEEARHLADIHADDVVIVENSAGLEAASSSGRIALILAIEGAEPIGNSLEILDVLRRSGVRMCSLSWNRRTMMADGIAERDTGGRLTQLGVDAVSRMEELGIIVDVSHLSEAGFFHLAELATRPFIASHSSCRSVTDHPRNLSDEQLRLIRDSHSFVGINAFGPFIAEGEPSLDAYIDHVEHALSVVGPESVGLGTDFIEDVAEVVDPIFTGLLVNSSDIPTTQGLRRPSDFQGLARAMSRRIGTEKTADVMGSNLRTFLTSQLG
ncbi:dipeptidase [Paenarthrobacter sp. YJN-5]|uniref:dipeptidase n=1 Tax=unclassified Paenarthrobacter TaxID=2634190 RepID=UPI001877ADA3|nr:membrane dipeptidase [Paenarthrobacter sp. YJN-5]QOT19927.1 thermostable dipeptidase [Paenarthrobacter sp. YJN-5]